MKQSDFKLNSVKFYPVLLLEDILPHNVRHTVFFFNRILAVGFLVLVSIVKIADVPDLFIVKVLGLFLLFFGFALTVRLLEGFFRSYFDHIEISEFEAGRVLLRGRDGDLVSALFSGAFGKELVRRLDITKQDLATFLSSRDGHYNYDLPLANKNGFFKIEDLAKSLISQDGGFKAFLFERDLGEKDIVGALSWLVAMGRFKAYKGRWWSRGNLSQIKAIGKSWAFGRTPKLDSVGIDLTTDPELFRDRSERSFCVSQTVS